MPFIQFNFHTRFLLLLLRLISIVAVLRWATVLIWSVLLITTATAAIALLVATSAIPSLLLVAVSFVHLCATSLCLDVFLHQVDNLVWNTEVFDCTASDVAFVHAPELVTVLKYAKLRRCTGSLNREIYLRGADDLAEIDIHPCVAAHQVAIVSLAIFQLHELK